MDVLAFPLRFTASGRAATVQQRSTEHCAQQISQFVQTHPGELPLALTYGFADPAFRDVDPAELSTGIALFHPQVRLTDVFVGAARDDGTRRIRVEFVQAALPQLPRVTEQMGGVTIGA